MKLIFDWDEEKARRNRSKHKVSFDEARTTFKDPFLVTFPDEYHSHEEERFISIGTSSKSRVILTVHMEYQEDDVIVIRFINAKNVTPAEREIYERKKD